MASAWSVEGCPTVGLAGGWLPGGGHGPLTSAYGLGADNALEFEIVTLDGQHTTASPTFNSDLYWALSGGGAGTYAVVLSITIRAHLDGPVAGTSWAFINTNPNAFWAAVEAWVEYLLVIEHDFPTLKTSVTFNNAFFQLSLATLPDATSTNQLNTALSPFIERLKSLNISLVTNQTLLSPTFLHHYTSFPSTYVDNLTIGDRLIPRSLVQDATRLSQLITLVRSIATNNTASVFVFVGTNVSESRVGISPGSNSVLPAWRDAALL